MPSLKDLRNPIASVQSTQKTARIAFLPPLAGEAARRAEGGWRIFAARALFRDWGLAPSVRCADTSPVNGRGMNCVAGG